MLQHVSEWVKSCNKVIVGVGVKNFGAIIKVECEKYPLLSHNFLPSSAFHLCVSVM